jgi:hypothetical protein
MKTKSKKKTKLTGKALEIFSNAGKKGARTRAKRYSKKQLQEWARMGGRPAENK